MKNLSYKVRGCGTFISADFFFLVKSSVLNCLPNEYQKIYSSGFFPLHDLNLTNILLKECDILFSTNQ